MSLEYAEKVANQVDACSDFVIHKSERELAHLVLWMLPVLRAAIACVDNPSGYYDLCTAVREMQRNA